LSSPHLEASPATTFRACSSPAPTRVKSQPAPAILSQGSVHTTLSITHHTRKRPSTSPRTTHGPHLATFSSPIRCRRRVLLLRCCRHPTRPPLPRRPHGILHPRRPPEIRRHPLLTPRRRSAAVGPRNAGGFLPDPSQPPRPPGLRRRRAVLLAALPPAVLSIVASSCTVVLPNAAGSAPPADTDPASCPPKLGLADASKLIVCVNIFLVYFKELIYV
jgi:hypothetical protein